MGDSPSTSTSVSAIAAMVTPGLLMLGSASLAASALVRMARVVDRARVMSDIARLPLALAISGTLLLLGGAVGMVAESTLSSEQIAEEIRIALTRLKGPWT